MTPRQAYEAIRAMNIPAKAKAELMMLWHKCKNLVEAAIRFCQRHREFAEAMILGAMIAYLLSHIPWIGGFLGLCALVTAAAIGVLKELREDIASLFEPIIQQA
jgi:uncharacterized membrane protein